MGDGLGEDGEGGEDEVDEWLLAPDDDDDDPFEEREDVLIPAFADALFAGLIVDEDDEAIEIGNCILFLG